MSSFHLSRRSDSSLVHRSSTVRLGGELGGEFWEGKEMVRIVVVNGTGWEKWGRVFAFVDFVAVGGS